MEREDLGLDEEKRLFIVSVCAPRVGERRVRERGGRGGAGSMEELTAEKGKIEWRGTLRTGGRGGGEKEDRKEGRGLLERNNHDVVIQTNANSQKGGHSKWR